MKRYVANVPRIIHETIHEETILIDTVSGTYYSMRGSGPQIWAWLLSGAALDELIAAWEALPGVSADLASQVETFWAALIDDELIVPMDDASQAVGIPATPAAWERPILEKFTDVQSLLVVDPIHEAGESGWPHRS